MDPRTTLKYFRMGDRRQQLRCFNFFKGFLGTVRKTVRPILSDRCPALTVTLVYCGQKVGWINMKRGMEVGLGPGHIVLYGDQLPSPKRGTSAPNFSAHVHCGQTVGWIKMPLAMEVGLAPQATLC